MNSILDINEFFRLISLAFAGSIGMTFIILACGLPQYKVWWPFFVVVFYFFAPIPTLMARRYCERIGTTNSSMDLAIFITMGIAISSFGLPIVLARSTLIEWGACWLTVAGNVVIYLTYLGLFLTLQDDGEYSMW